MSEPKRHYYAMCFIYGIDRAMVHQCLYYGLPHKNITVSDIESAKSEGEMPHDACLISASYMGYMTTNEVKGDRE